MRDYIMDMRKALTELLSLYDEDCGFWINNPTHPHKQTYQYEQRHYENVYYEDIQEGDRLYAFDNRDGYMTEAHYWVEIEVTHKYGGVIFYKILNPPTEDEKWLKERHFEKGSVMYLMNLMPKKVVINKGYNFVCCCPLVEFITDENMENKYPSVFENTEERRY